MVRRCALCDATRSEDIALHAFPANANQLAKWKQACGYVESDNVKTLRICSRHFQPLDFVVITKTVTTSNERVLIKKLKRDVVPTVDLPYNVGNISPHESQSSVAKRKRKQEALKRSYLPKKARLIVIQSEGAEEEILGI